MSHLKNCYCLAHFLSTVVLVTPMYSQYPISNCTSFYRLLTQPGLQISAQIEEQYLFPREMIQPTIVVRNSTNATLEIPTIESKSGVLVDVSEAQIKTRGYLPKVEVCAFPTEKILPGQEKHFPIEFDFGNLFNQENGSKSTYLPAASQESGKHGFIVDLGNFSTIGRYTVVQPKVEAFGCIEKRDQPSNGMTTYKMEKSNRCTPVSILSNDGEFYLMAGATSMDLATYSMHLEEVERSRPGSIPSIISSTTPVRIMKLSGPTAFSTHTSKSPIPERQFKIQSVDGTELSLDKIQASWQDRRRQLGRR